MQALDFSRSFVTFVTPGRANNARIQVESVCRLSPAGGEPVELFLVASCKAEDTYAERNLFRLPNYDFCALFSAERYRIVRTPVSHDASMQEGGAVQPRFDEVLIQRREVPAEPLASAADIVAATLAGRPLVARTWLAGADGAVAEVAYPIKTMNVNDQRDMWQFDTGPVAVPVDAGWDGDPAGFELAFIAANSVDWVELLLRRPAPLGERMVDHYGEVRVVEAQTLLLAV